jgi:hypothetical protein
MARWIKKTTTRDKLWKGRGGPTYAMHRKAPEKYLINAYLDEPQGLHIRRTLDQSHYSMLPNTEERDKDQVLERHRGDQVRPAVIMVDQLWLWIIDGKFESHQKENGEMPPEPCWTDILITSFPLRMDQSDGRDVLDSVLKYIRSRDRPPLFKPHGLASVIIEHCTGVLTTASNRLTPEYGILDVFGSAIRKVVSSQSLST